MRGEPSGSNRDDDDDVQGNEFHEFHDTISIADELSEAEETFEDAHLEFDPTFAPIEKWTRDHPKEKILGVPSSSVLTRAQV